MKTVIIYESIHHGNTEKIAQAMTCVLEAQLLKPSEVDVVILTEYDLICFAQAFIFSTRSSPQMIKPSKT